LRLEAPTSWTGAATFEAESAHAIAHDKAFPPHDVRLFESIEEAGEILQSAGVRK
jgi:hypothetical protein